MPAALLAGQPAPRPLGQPETPIRTASAAGRQPGLLRRLYAAFVKARMREAERRIGAYIHDHGGRLTDDIERRILEDVVKSTPHRFNG